MKNLFLVSIVWFFNFQVNCQSVEWASDEGYVMYINFNNVLPLKFKNVDENYLELKASYGEIIKNDEQKFIWIGKQPGNTDHILTVNYKGKVIGEFKKKFKRMPDPVVVTLPVPKVNLKSFTGIKCIFPSMKINPCFVQSYIIQITYNGDVSTLSNTGGEISKNNKKALKYVPSKAEVSIVSIFVRCPGDGAGRRVNNIQIQ